MKKLLFSVTIKDCEVQVFRCGGKGGQNVNKVNSGVRIIHHPSGAAVRCCDTRDQLKNKRLAFERMANTPEFKKWHKIETAKLLAGSNYKPVEEIVEEAMAPDNLKVEIKDANGKWCNAGADLSTGATTDRERHS
jgi:protein subunit release factor B